MILGAYEAEITGGRVEFPMQRREHPLVALAGGAISRQSREDKDVTAKLQTLGANVAYITNVVIYLIRILK